MRSPFVSILLLLVLGRLAAAEDKPEGLHASKASQRLLEIARNYLPADYRYPITENKMKKKLAREFFSLLPVTIRQQPTDSTCGPASLGIHLSFYGQKVDDATLAKATGVTDDGVDPEPLAAAAETFGYEAKGTFDNKVKDLIDALKTGHPVMIDYQASYGPDDKPGDQGHYSVVVASDENDVLLVDPSETNPYQIRRIPQDKLQNIWWDTYILKPGEMEEKRFDGWMMTLRPKPKKDDVKPVAPAMPPMAMNMDLLGVGQGE